jgi:hypothetical protein
MLLFVPIAIFSDNFLRLTDWERRRLRGPSGPREQVLIRLAHKEFTERRVR